jgi:dihydrofolate reductase
MQGLPERRVAIAAMAENRAIGYRGAIPWHLPEDFRFFKQTTLGHILVMGRRTYESIGRPLPGRETIVLTSHPETLPSNPHLCSLKNLSDRSWAGESRTLFICGGAQVYAAWLPHCTELILTHVHASPEADVFFPPFEHLFSPAETLHSQAEFHIVRYRPSQLSPSAPN